MQAESGSIAELQKYHNKYLKNRRHTLANTAAINLRWVAKINLLRNFPTVSTSGVMLYTLWSIPKAESGET